MANSLKSISYLIDLLNFASAKAKLLKTWAAKSYWNTLLLVAFGVAIIEAPYVISISYLQDKYTEEVANYRDRSRYLSQEIELSRIQDQLSTCIDARNMKEKLSPWYCEKAVLSFKRAFPMYLQEQLDEYIEKNAYAGMRDVVKYRLRSLALDQLRLSNESANRNILTVLLSKTVLYTILIIATLVPISIYVFLWAIPKRKREKFGAIDIP